MHLLSSPPRGTRDHAIGRCAVIFFSYFLSPIVDLYTRNHQATSCSWRYGVTGCSTGTAGGREGKGAEISWSFLVFFFFLEAKHVVLGSGTSGRAVEIP